MEDGKKQDIPHKPKMKKNIYVKNNKDWSRKKEKWRKMQNWETM